MTAEMVLAVMAGELKPGDRIVLFNVVFRIDRVEAHPNLRRRTLYGELQHGAPFNVSFRDNQPVVLTHLERR